MYFLSSFCFSSLALLDLARTEAEEKKLKKIAKASEAKLEKQKEHKKYTTRSNHYQQVGTRQSRILVSGIAQQKLEQLVLLFPLQKIRRGKSCRKKEERSGYKCDRPGHIAKDCMVQGTRRRMMEWEM